MKKLFIVFSVIVISCTVQQTETIRPSRQSVTFPGFDIIVKGFIAYAEDSDSPFATDEDNINSRKITVSEKNIVLEALDTIKFTVNTPEFEELMMAQTYYAGADFSGSLRSVKQGDEYDKEILLQAIKDRIGLVTIRKEQMPFTCVFAMGQLPIDTTGRTYNAYVDDLTHSLSLANLFISLNNRDQWDSVDFYHNQGFLAGVIFHELLHNMGFTHADPLDVNKDTVYILGNVLTAVYNTDEFQEKYETALAAFRPFYPSLFSEYLLTDTIAVSRSREATAGTTMNFSEIDISELFHDEFMCVYDEENHRFVMLKN